MTRPRAVTALSAVHGGAVENGQRDGRNRILFAARGTDVCSGGIPHDHAAGLTPRLHAVEMVVAFHGREHMRIAERP